MDALAQSGSIVFGARDWSITALILAGVVVGLAVWSYASRSQLSWGRFLAALLKSLAVAALAFCLVEPMRRTERPRPGANLMAVVVDNSRSMQMHAPGQAKSRVDRLRSQLPSETPWQARLAQDFDVRRYAFDERLRAVEDLSELNFAGNSSSLVDSIHTLQTRFQSRPVAGMLLFTDGIATDRIESLMAQEEFPFAIYPVLESSRSALADISLREPSIAISSFELAPVTLETTLDARGLDGQDITVRLMTAEGTTLDKQTLPCQGDAFSERVRFQFQPATAGVQFVQVRAMLTSEDSEAAAPTSRTEVTTANNSRLVTVNRGGGPFRILYVAGRPNWEFKFIRRALEEDLEVDLAGLVRIAKQEPKFSFRDKGVDSTNPLMAGFSEDAETAEQYDEPVLLRLGVENSDELKTGFPATAESLYRYQAIILDDVEASFFTQQQMLLIREFVAARGGGLMMLGGQESFLGGGYRDTPLGDVLPVYLRGQESAVDKDQTVRYRLTREGALEPWLRLRSTQGDEQVRVEQMPDFLNWNVVSDVKPGAAVLAEISTADGTAPGLVAQRFGKGRSLALMVGDFWRWSMRRATEDTDDLAQSWRQMARWLTNDVPQRIEAEVTTSNSPLEPQRIIIQLRDEAFQPLDNASLKIQITEPDGQQVTAAATPDPARLGQYVAEYWSQADGGYLCEIEATGPDGEVFEPLRTGWSAQPSAAEFASVDTNVELLRQLAERSGGEVVPVERLENFVAGLSARKVPITEIRIEPLWHQPWLVLLALGCLCLEWGIRRWRGLP